MSWAVGFDPKWNRDVGYGVPAFCDHPQCAETIDRGLSHVCGGDPFGGDRGCGLYFCGAHLRSFAQLPQLCERCGPRLRSAYGPTPDHPEWVAHKLSDPSWRKWRAENKALVKVMRAAAAAANGKDQPCTS